MEKEVNNKYGLLTIMSIIIGTVIGSGIYVKNDSLMDISESSILVFVGWIISGLLVISILIIFIEVVSITNKKNTQGTFSNYGTYLWNKRIGIIMGIYFTFFYLPIAVTMKAVFGTEKLFVLFDNGSNLSNVNNWIISSIVGFILLLIIIGTTVYFLKTTNGILKIGTIIKTIPLFIVIFIGLFTVIGLFNFSSGGTQNIFDPNSDVNTGLSTNESNFISLFLLVPPMMFTFDGFLFANSLSTESKSKNTFKVAAISSIVIIILLYILFSTFGIYLSDGNNFQIQNVISNLFPGANVFIDIIMFMVFISIFSSSFGSAVASLWSISDSSNKNIIPDKNGYLIRRSKRNLNPTYSGFVLLGISIVIFIYFRVFDGISMLFVENESFGYSSMTNYITNYTSLTNFVFYSIIVLGALRNRVTKKEETDKSKLLWVCGVFSLTLIAFIVISQFYDLTSSLFLEENKSLAILKLFMVIILYTSIIVATIIIMKLNTEEESELKKELVTKYNNREPYEEQPITSNNLKIENLDRNENSKRKYFNSWKIKIHSIALLRFQNRRI